jgi:hypothetical protein
MLGQFKGMSRVTPFKFELKGMSWAYGIQSWLEAVSCWARKIYFEGY